MTANMTLVPGILRARGFRLYTKDGSRLVDLWQNGGAAILGHTPPNILRELKNTASRGLYAPFPHFTENRFLKALTKLFPGYYFRLYAERISRKGAKDAEDAKGKNEEEGLREEVGVWRPYVNPNEPFAVEKDVKLFTPILPGLQFGLSVVAAKSEDDLAKLPQSDMLSPVLLAVASRGVYDLLASAQRGRPKLPRVFKALQDSPWKRRGIYLSLKDEPSPQMWDELFKKFLDAGFLLPPVLEQPVILPGELSDGEDAKLAILLK